MRRRAAVALALARPTVRSLPWRLLGGGWALGVAVAAVPALFALHLPAAVLADVARVAALCGAVGTAFALDDPARHTTGTVPVPRPLRQTLRVAVAGLAGALWWAAVLGAVRAGADAGTWAGVPAGALTVEAAALSGLALALAGAAVRFSAVRLPGPAVAAALPAPPVAAAVFLPDGYALFVPPGDPRWADAHTLWAGILTATLAVWAACALEPRHRSGRVPGRTRGGEERGGATAR
ncbi:ABC transporter [Streptomyces sp. HM190]|uniref:ABC transporter n=1 Tax=Streptomyces sp. HM190 TaxID=2695266 RepID=UPI0019176751|nr:ABC transporter [Streptomyces sp. HM190]